LSQDKGWDFLGHCGSFHFQPRGSNVQKWVLLVLVLGEFIVHLIMMSFFFN